jgi:nucleoid DNA-binding protein
MTKAELVDQVAATVQLPKNKIDAVITRFLQGIMEALHAGDHVELRGFGRFRLRHRQAREGRNPRTGDTVRIAAKAVPTFAAGKTFQEMVQPSAAPSEGANRLVTHGQTMER